jgi:succinate dehydrogenase / fumarate reductase flavoprotein subunit
MGNGATIDDEQLQATATKPSSPSIAALPARIRIRFNTTCRKRCRTWSASFAQKMKCNRHWRKSRQLQLRADRAGIAGHRQYNNGWHTAIDLSSLLVVSEAITRAALLRKESRGAQFREDFPNKDAEWGKHNIIVKRGADGEMLVEKRALPPMPDELKAVIQEMK